MSEVKLGQTMNSQENKAPPPANPFAGVGSAPAVKPLLNFAPPSGLRDLPITLPSLELAVLRVPVPMSTEDFDALVSALNAMKKKLVGTPVASQMMTDMVNDFLAPKPK